MAIYRTRGLYALNQPSRYVGQSEDFRDWLHTAPEEDVALCERASEFEEHALTPLRTLNQERQNF